MTNILLDVKTVEDYEQRIAELEGERDKLREALQTIADECEIEFQYAKAVVGDARIWVAGVANAALKGE